MNSTTPTPEIQDLRPFDSCITLGRIVLSSVPECLPDADSVLRMLDRYHIEEALVHEHHARVIYPREHGNARLIEAVKGHPRLHPVWVLEPPKIPGPAAADALVDTMLSAGVRAARLAMRAVAPFPWLWSDLCMALERHRVPCFLDFAGLESTQAEMTDTDVQWVRELALAHPDLIMILSNQFGGLGVHPAVIPLIRRTKNIVIDTSGILDTWLTIAREVAVERVLFATGAPFSDPGVLISNVQYDRHLSPDEKAMIYGGNLRRLLDGVS